MEHEHSPDVRDLRAFCLVVDLGSVTAAARVLHETKGSVSRRLSRLEEGLGIALVRRSPKLVTPTDEGADYRSRVGRALELLDDAGARLRGVRDAPRGRLRVTAPNDIAVSMLGPLVARFIERHPDVAVDMVLTERRLDLEAEHIDVAFRASAALEDSSLVAHRVRDLEGALFASPAYLAQHGAPSSPDDLASHRILVMSGLRTRRMLPLRLRAAPPSAPADPATTGRAPASLRDVALIGGAVRFRPGNVTFPRARLCSCPRRCTLGRCATAIPPRPPTTRSPAARRSALRSAASLPRPWGRARPTPDPPAPRTPP